MRSSSAVFVLAAAAAVAPAFAAPVSQPSFARRQTTATPDDSDAISLGTIGTIFSLGAPVVSGIIDHFKNNGQQRRELMDLLARAEVDESGALKLGDAANIASIGSSVVSVFHNLFGGYVIPTSDTPACANRSV